jgi:hypothetical protein
METAVSLKNQFPSEIKKSIWKSQHTLKIMQCFYNTPSIIEPAALQLTEKETS